MNKTVCALALTLTLLPAAARAELDSAKAGEIQSELDRRQGEVKKQYEGRKLSPEERKEFQQKMQSVSGEVLNKHGTSEAEFSRSTRTMNKDERSQMEASRKSATDKASKKDEKPAEAKPGVEVQKGVIIERGPQGGAAPGKK